MLFKEKVYAKQMDTRCTTDEDQSTTIVGILTFMSRIIFVLSRVEHGKSFITSGPELSLLAYVLSTIITQPFIYGVIVYFFLCHESVNYCLGNSFRYCL